MLDDRSYKYISGKWSWDNKSDSLHFEPHHDLENVRDRYIETNGYKFLRTLNQVEEAVFRQEYERSESAFDRDAVSINDVRDLVFFLMPKEFLTMKFLEFMHKPAVHRLLHALIIYFEYFLRLVEFVLIRRDELAGDMAQIQSEQTNETKRIWSIYLSQYRMLVARNYSVILKSEGDLAKFYHMKPVIYTSTTLQDRSLHEKFLAVAIQIVWITMHRRAYYVIEKEMNRLFRSEHFIINRPEYMKLTAAERSFLYGRRNKNVNYLSQVSPLILELENVDEEDLPILWIGKRKYRGVNIRIATIELEYIVPDTQLLMIDVTHGILGHPKRFYDTILNINWSALRLENYSLETDPYHIIRQPTLRIPNVDAKQLHKMSQRDEHFFKIFHIYEPFRPEDLRKWLQREKRLLLFAKGETKLNIYIRCQRELEEKSGTHVEQKIKKYFKLVSRLRKETNFTHDDNNLNIAQFNSKGAKHQRSSGDRFFGK
ncbi:hypothetical protein ACLKA6_007929 [Drosophila palustris]